MFTYNIYDRKGSYLGVVLAKCYANVLTEVERRWPEIWANNNAKQSNFKIRLAF